MTYSMECMVCGSGGLFERAENEYGEDERDTCKECGVVHQIRVDDFGDDDGGLTAYADTDERAEDRGQARCDGSDCRGAGAVKEMLGTPCLWTCSRATSNGWKRPPAPSVQEQEKRARPLMTPRTVEGITPGPCEVVTFDVPQPITGEVIAVASPTYDAGPFMVRLVALCGTADDPDRRETSEADARFIAEAFTVAHETGKSPRELVEEVGRLRRICQRLLETNGGPIDPEDTTDGLPYVMVRRTSFDALAVEFGQPIEKAQAEEEA